MEEDHSDDQVKAYGYDGPLGQEKETGAVQGMVRLAQVVAAVLGESHGYADLVSDHLLEKNFFSVLLEI